MSLSDKEKNFVNLDNPQVSPNALLAAKVFANRAPNIDAIVRTFKPIWRTRKDFHIRAVGNQVLLFNFELDTGTDCVLLSEPWSFDRILFCSQDTLRENQMVQAYLGLLISGFKSITPLFDFWQWR